MAANVTGISRPIDLGATLLTAAAVGVSDAPGETVLAYPGGFIFAPGIDGSSNCNYFENSETVTAANNWYSAWGSFSSIDMTGAGKCFAVHFRVNSTYNNIGKIRIALRSGTGTSNWGFWEFTLSGSSKDITIYNPFRIEGTPDYTGGTFDPTDITGVALQVQTTNTDLYALSCFWDQFLFIDGKATLGDTGGAEQVGLQNYFDLLKSNSSEIYRSKLVNKAGSTFEFGFGIEFQTNDYKDSSVATGLSFSADDGLGIRVAPLGFYQARWVPPASATQLFSGFTIATVSTDYDLYIDGSNSGVDLTFNSSLFAGINTAEITGINCTISNSNILSPESCSIEEISLNSVVIDDVTNPIQWIGDLAANSRLLTNSDVDILFDVGDYSDITVIFTDNCEVTLDPATNNGDYILTGFNSTFTINFDIPLGNTFNTTVITDSNLITPTRTNPTTGGGTIILDNPVFTPTLTLTNLNNPTEVRVYDASDGTEIYGEENVTGGVFTTTIPPDVDNINIAIISIQYDNINFLNLPVGNNDISIPIQQKFDRWYNNPV